MQERYLEEKRREAIKDSIPIISKNTEYFLKDFLSTHQITSIIEIGGATGYSALVFNYIVGSYSSLFRIYSREISYPHYYQSLVHTKNNPNIITYLGNFTAYNIKKYLGGGGKYDLVFIDARKSETLDYIKKLSSILHTTKYIIVDDAIKFKYKMKNFYSFLDKNNINYTIKNLDKDDGILILPVTESLLQALFSQSDL